MRLFDTQQDSLDALAVVFARRSAPAEARAVQESVQAILGDVRARGDAAVLDYTRRWDCPAASTLRVAGDEIEAAKARVQQTPLWPVLEVAAARIRSFHEKHKRQSWMDVSAPGEMLGQIIRPLARVGVYVPGGTAAYPSTVLMAAIPARVAGVDTIVVATPPGRDGRVPDATLAACQVAGVTEVYAMGGAQAIGALAYGTETIPPMDKIVGPGNLYVNLAKRLVYGVVGIDLLAGPSEVGILADEAADPGAAAADVLAQCEHDAHCSALIATPSEAFARAVVREIDEQIATLPARGEIVRAALASNGFLVRTQSLDEAAGVMSRYAPEHLHLLVREPWGLLARIENAGAILIGAHTSAPLGDYVLGPSHTLPTAGCARFSSPLNIDDFMKKTSVAFVDAAAAARLAPLAAVFANVEGLPAHARAAVRDATPHHRESREKEDCPSGLL